MRFLTKWGTCDRPARLFAASRRQRVDPRSAQRRVVRPRPDFGRRHRHGQYRPGPHWASAAAVSTYCKFKRRWLHRGQAGVLSQCGRISQLCAAGIAAQHGACTLCCGRARLRCHDRAEFSVLEPDAAGVGGAAIVHRRTAGGHCRQECERGALPLATCDRLDAATGRRHRRLARTPASRGRSFDAVHPGVLDDICDANRSGERGCGAWHAVTQRPLADFGRRCAG